MTVAGWMGRSLPATMAATLSPAWGSNVRVGEGVGVVAGVGESGRSVILHKGGGA